MGPVSEEFAIVDSPAEGPQVIQVVVVIAVVLRLVSTMGVADHHSMPQIYFAHTVPTLLTTHYNSRLCPAAMPDSHIKMASL